MRLEIYIREKGASFEKIYQGSETKIYHLTNKNSAVAFFDGDVYDVRMEASLKEMEHLFKQQYQIIKKI
jgi:hypothetical protein